MCVWKTRLSRSFLDECLAAPGRLPFPDNQIPCLCLRLGLVSEVGTFLFGMLAVQSEIVSFSHRPDFQRCQAPTNLKMPKDIWVL